MSFKLGLRSKLRLRGVHPDLVKVVERAITISKVDFTVIEGVRTVARQKQLVAQGASRTIYSRHIPGVDGLGKAVDLAPWVDGKVRWDWPLFYSLADAMMKAAEELGVALVWGGNWKTFKDGPHFELDRKQYP